MSKTDSCCSQDTNSYIFLSDCYMCIELAFFPLYNEDYWLKRQMRRSRIHARKLYKMWKSRISELGGEEKS